MTGASPQRNLIVRQLEREGNAHALAHTLEVADFHRRERLRRMVILVADLLDEMDTRGDTAKLTALGVAVMRGAGMFSLVSGHGTLNVQPRDDMSVEVGGVIVHPNRTCPVLDGRCYDEIIGEILKWASFSLHGRA